MKTIAIVADIQRSSVHDGPGFRTTVFFKGCQLRCVWCHNPETIAFEKQILHYPEKCIGCGKCEEGCFAGAKVTCGREMTLEEVFREIEPDRPYYGSEGGVTLSGGEPLCQAEFASALVQKCKTEGIQCAMESNLCMDWRIAEPVVRQLSLLMCDLKIWNDEKHTRYVGASNRRIIENLRFTQETGVPLVVRTPVIPSVNADIDEIVAIASYAAKLSNLKYYELLSYHPLGLSKAKALGMEMIEFEKPTRALMEELAKAAVAAGIPVMVNGISAEAFIKRR